jgi:hypothetical protein
LAAAISSSSLEDPFEKRAKPATAIQVLLDPLEVPRQDRPRVAFQHRRDLAQRHTELSQCPNLVQPADVRLVIEAMPGLGALRRGQQADLVVVMERPHGQPGGRRKLADLPLLLVHGGHRRPHVT